MSGSYAGGSQARVAEELDTTINTVSSWERGINSPSPYFRQRLCALFEKNASELGLIEEIGLIQESIPITSTMGNSNRARFLKKVHAFWIKGFLEQALASTLFIPLKLHEQPDAVVVPMQSLLEQYTVSMHPLINMPSIVDMYDEADGELFILGEPGSGKTTLLLSLLQVLLKRAEVDREHPLPVLFHLSSWSQKWQSIAAWIVQELHDKYQVPLKLGQQWVEVDQILPLLDGLDEVHTRDRATCIDAINLYRKEHGLLPLVICSRTEEYSNSRRRLSLSRAIEIEPLTFQQIEEYLQSMQDRGMELRKALEQDAELRELTRTPLILRIVATVYQEQPAMEIVARQTIETRKKQLLLAYTRRMFAHEGGSFHYSPEKTTRWLSWVARQMDERSQTMFSLEQLQSNWLPSLHLQDLYRRIIALLFGLLLGLVNGLACGIFFRIVGIVPYALIFWMILGLSIMSGGLFGLLHWQHVEGNTRKQTFRLNRWQGWKGFLHFGLFLTVGSACIYCIKYWSTTDILSLIAMALIIGLVLGLSGGVLSGFLLGTGIIKPPDMTIVPVKIVTWSWKSMWQRSWNNVLRGIISGLTIGFGIALILAILSASSLGVYAGFELGLIIWLLVGSVTTLAMGLSALVAGGISQNHLAEKQWVHPNEGIWRSARNSLLIGGVSGLAIGIVFAVINEITSRAVPEIMMQVLGHIGNTSSISTNIFTRGLLIALLSALASTLIIGMRTGGAPCIQHIILRLFLWRANYLPWNCPRFLEEACRRILLRRAGREYLFVHQLLQDYFKEV